MADIAGERERRAQRRKADAMLLACVPFFSLSSLLYKHTVAPWFRPETLLADFALSLTTLYLTLLPGLWLAWIWLPAEGPDRAGWRRLIAFAAVGFFALTLYAILFLGRQPVIAF